MMKKQYVLTERAHFMCPNMHFGMIMEIEKEFIAEKVRYDFNRESRIVIAHFNISL